MLPFLLVAGLAGASEIPFSGPKTIDADFDSAGSNRVADIDGDGDLDVVGVAQNADEVAWWENSAGDGSAWTKTTVDADFDSALSVRVADMDGDGDLDLVGAAMVADEVAWWMNTAGDGSTWTKLSIDTAFDGAVNIYLADMDADGDLDVVGSAAFSDEIAWWANAAGDGSVWTKTAIDGAFDGALSVYAADMDGDGDLDVVGSAGVSDEIAWWENTAGDGSVWTKTAVDLAFELAVSVSAADMDGDGDIDIVAPAQDGDEIAWWSNTVGDGSAWAKQTIASVDLAREVFLEDMDADGDLDVLGSAFLDDEIAWWENTAGDASAWTEHTIASNFDGARSVFAADLDGDGDLDAVATAGLADDVTWWENETIHRSAAFPEKATVAGDFDSAISVGSADVDGDGDIDILGAAFADDAITWWENTSGDGSAWMEHTIDGAFAGPRAVHAADVDGDGDVDVLGAARDDDDITWWENTLGDGSTWTEHAIDDDFNGAYSVYTADIDGDGTLDVIGSGQFTDEVVWWANTAGDGSAWTKTTVGAIANPFSVYAGDVDGDGDLDVLSAANAADDITWWENTSGDGSTWAEDRIDGFFGGAQSVFAADIDGDGDLDVLGAAKFDNDITWWENTSGDGSTWAEDRIDGAFSGAFDVYAADLDEDGDLDVLGAATDGSDISWWENTVGDGSAWFEHRIDTSFGAATSVSAADLDGDGDLDVFGAAFGVGDIAWWANRGGQFALPTDDVVEDAQLALGSTDVSLLEVTAVHRGRSGDADVELVTLELLFEQAEGDPLTGEELDNLATALRVYRDDGDGDFDASLDFEFFTAAPPFALTSGVLTATLVDGEADAQVALGTDETYFVAVDLQATGTALEVPSTFQVTHLTESSSTAEMATTDLPVTLEFSNDTASSLVSLTGPPEIAVSTLELMFGTQALGAGPSAAQMVTIVNEGFDDLTVASVELVGANADDFSIVSDSGEATLGPAAVRTVVLEFEPSSIGVFNASLQVISGDTDEPTIDVLLSGEGVAASVFADGFESGGTGQWSSSTGGSR